MRRKRNKHAREKIIDSILVQPQFSTRDDETIAREINGKKVVADPLAAGRAEKSQGGGRIV